MLGQILTATALVALTQAKAIVTNNCPFTVYLWSIPNVVGASLTENVPIKSGGHYQEPWRLGSPTNPGVAIKISSRANGINEGADETNFAYAIDPKDDSKIWVDLSQVRGEPFKVLFHTCLGESDSADAGTVQCAVTDEVELVLCGTIRSTSATDTASLEQIKAYYDNKHSTKADEKGEEGYATASQSSKREEPLYATEELSGAPQHAQLMSTSIPTFDKNTNQPMAQRKSSLHQCLARVVYKRSQRAPIPSGLSRNTTTPAISTSTSTTLCDIVQKYHPSVEDECDEEVMRSRAEEIYPRICDPATEPLLMGFQCEEVMQELQNVYPDVAVESANASNSTCACDTSCNSCIAGNGQCDCVDTMDTVDTVDTVEKHSLASQGPGELCFEKICKDISDGLDCSRAESITHVFTDLLDIDWDRYFNASCSVPINRMPQYNGTTFVCIRSLCEEYDSEKCVATEKMLFHLAKILLNKDVFFTTDGFLCEGWIKAKE